MPHADAARLPVTLPSTPAEIEILIGQVTAAAVGALAAAVQDWQRDGDAGSGSDIRLAAGDWIAELVMLKQAVAGEIIDFESTARTHALQLLRQRCGANVSDGLLAILIDDVLRIVARVCATQWH